MMFLLVSLTICAPCHWSSHPLYQAQTLGPLWKSLFGLLDVPTIHFATI
jgi:hypothetical protein